MARRIVALLILVAATAVAIDWLADMTQTRPDEQRPGARTEIVFEVKTRRYRQDAATAAAGLWGECSATVSSRLQAPGIEQLDAERFRLVVKPALGAHGQDRVEGCLRDHTMDRVLANVVSVRHLPE